MTVVTSIQTLDNHERDRLLSAYRSMRCDIWDGRGWHPWTTTPNKPLALISAWNPGLRPASGAANAVSDARLMCELVALGLHPQRARGRSGAAGSGSEEGWLVPYQAQRCLVLLRRYGQAAGLVFTDAGRSVLWADGRVDQLDTDRCAVPAAPKDPL